MDLAERFGKTAFTVLAVVFLLGYSMGNFFHSGGAVMEAMAEARPGSIGDIIAAVDNAVVERMLWRYPFIECYGRIQLAQGKHEINSFESVKDKAGYLHSGNFWVGFHDESKELAVRVRRLHDLLVARGTQVCFIMPPMKVAGEEMRYEGIPYNDFTGQGDEMLRWLRYYGVPCLDLRQSFKAHGLSYGEAFFKTDHHWTPRAAFAGFCDMIEWLNGTFGTDFDPENFYRDLDNYTIRTYERIMLGSQGRNTGVDYAEGMEDYTILIPKDEGNYNWIRGDLKRVEDVGALSRLELLENADAVNQQAGLENLRGSDGLFTATLLKLPQEELEGEEIYHGVAEKTYLEEIMPYDFIRNNNRTGDGMSVLFLRDSYASPVISFFAQCVSPVEAAWTNQYDSQTMESLLARKDYDYVIIMLYPENLSYEFFPFCESEELP